MFRKIPFGRIIPPFFFESSESDRVLNYLHDSNSIFRARGIKSEGMGPHGNSSAVEIIVRSLSICLEFFLEGLGEAAVGAEMSSRFELALLYAHAPLPLRVEMEQGLMRICPRRPTFFLFRHRSRRQPAQQHRIRVSAAVNKKKIQCHLNRRALNGVQKLSNSKMLFFTEAPGLLKSCPHIV